jgi:hypothetical protein
MQEVDNWDAKPEISAGASAKAVQKKQGSVVRGQWPVKTRGRGTQDNADTEVGMIGNFFGPGLMKELIWGAGAVHVGIVLANVPLLGRLRVGERLAGVPRFLRQIVYVHWAYILIVVGMFAALCFGFAAELAGASRLGRFLSGFMAGFWLLRIGLQVFYYDKELRRENRGMDTLYVGSLIVLVGIFGMAVVRPVG